MPTRITRRAKGGFGRQHIESKALSRSICTINKGVLYGQERRNSQLIRIRLTIVRRAVVWTEPQCQREHPGEIRRLMIEYEGSAGGSMSAGKWIARNLSLGGIIKNVGGGAGTIANLGFRAIGAAAESVAGVAGKQDAKAIGDAIRSAGEFTDTALTKTGEGVGFLANKATEYAGKAGAEVAGFSAELANADPSTIATARKVGTFIGAAAVGMVAGLSVADAAVALAAAPGTAGAAATTSGLAALGGGSIATGGGGMAVGQAVTQGIVAASSVSGAIGSANPEE